MAYEVWIFQSQEDESKPSRLVSIAQPPPSYGLVDVHAWARQVEREYAKDGALVRAHVREEASY